MFKLVRVINHAILPFFFITLLIMGCSQGNSNPENVKQALLRADREFSDLSVKKGTAAAFYAFMEDSGLALPKYGHPLTREDYRRYLFQTQNEPRRNILKWEPLSAEVAASGDLGYTHGRYELILKDSAEVSKNVYGYYITVWKKQPDGSWRFVLDAGNESEKP